MRKRHDIEISLASRKEPEHSEEDWRLLRGDIRRLFRRARVLGMRARVRLADDIAHYTFWYDPKHDAAKQKARQARAPKPARALRAPLRDRRA